MTLFLTGSHDIIALHKFTVLHKNDDENTKNSARRMRYAEACRQMENIYEYRKNNDMVEKMYLEAINVYEENEYDRTLAVCHNNLGALYMEQKKYSDAEKEFGIALEIYDKLKKDVTDYAEDILNTQKYIAKLAEHLKREGK